MKKTRKRLFAFSGLVVLVAQVLVMALCSIPAIAVTREETNRTLFNNEHGSATISYEEMESGGLNWTINLQKAAHDTATRFMVAMTADGQAIMPENVQTVMQSTPEISFTAGNGEGLMLAGLQEGAAGSGAGSAVITYQTSGDYGQMAVVPKLVTVGDTVSDLLAGNPGVVYDIPVKEEPAATEEAVTGELPLNDGQTATTETTEADAVESTTDSQDAEITESTTESTATDEATEVTETTDSSDAVAEGEVVESGSEDSTKATESSSEAEDETGDISEATGAYVDSEDEATVNANQIDPTASSVTSLRFEKTWEDVPTDATDAEKTVELQLMRRVKGSSNPYENYGKPETFKYDTQVKEWNNLPAVEGEVEYEYTVKELPNQYYEITQKPEAPEESVINSLTAIQSCNSVIIETNDPSYFVARTKDGWFIWTASHISSDEERQIFGEKIQAFDPNAGPPMNQFLDISNFNDGTTVTWAEGNVSIPNLIDLTVDTTTTPIKVTVNFSDPSVWKQLMYGTNSTRKVKATNKYIPPTNINVEKKWMLDDTTIDNNEYNTQQDIQLVLQVLQHTAEGDNWVDVDGKVLDIPAGSTGDALKGSFEVPTMVDDGTGTYIEAQYQVVERYVDENGEIVNQVYGYSASTEGYTITNTLLKTALSFTKVDGQGNPLGGVTFDLSRDGMENDPWAPVTTSKDGKINFSDLPVGHYTLTETGTAPGYELPVAPENSWGFTVTDSNGTVEGMNIVWDKGENPFSDQNITNNGKIVNNLKPFDLTVNKVDDQKNPLAGATFELTDKDGNKLPDAVLENDGSSFVFKDLKPGTYTLTETKAPDGYAKLLNPITITISEDGTVTVEGKDNPVWDSDSEVIDGNNTITITVANKKLVPLPATGGPGTLLFFVMGILAIAVTGIYFVSRQKQEVA